MQAFLSIFRDVQQYSAMFEHIQAYSGIIKAYGAIIRRIHKPGLFRT